MESLLCNLEEYKEFKETENFFISNGRKINRYGTLEENGIKDSDIITLLKHDDNEE